MNGRCGAWDRLERPVDRRVMRRRIRRPEHEHFLSETIHVVDFALVSSNASLVHTEQKVVTCFPIDEVARADANEVSRIRVFMTKNVRRVWPRPMKVVTRKVS